MSNLMPGLVKTLIENPELGYDCIEMVSDLFSGKTINKIKDTVTNTCDFFDSILNGIFNVSHQPKESPNDVDYETQLEDLMSVVDFIYEKSNCKELVWDEGEEEYCYVCPFIDDDEQYEYKIFLVDNNCACLEIIAYEDNKFKNNVYIGSNDKPAPPILNKKLSSLFFLVEEMVLKEKRSKANQTGAVDSPMGKEYEKILSFLSRITEFTEKRLIAWEVKDGNKRRFRTLIKKANGTKVLIELLLCNNDFIEVRAAQIVDGKLKKLFHVNDDEDIAYAKIQSNVKRLYSIVESNFSEREDD